MVAVCYGDNVKLNVQQNQFKSSFCVMLVMSLSLCIFSDGWMDGWIDGWIGLGWLACARLGRVETFLPKVREQPSSIIEFSQLSLQYKETTQLKVVTCIELSMISLTLLARFDDL